MGPGTGSPKNLVVIIATINFEILESPTVWPIEVEKSGCFFILLLLPIVAGVVRTVALK